METKQGKIKFTAYDIRLIPLPVTQGGGFRLTMEVPEDQYEQVKDMNDPQLKNTPLEIEIKIDGGE